jgi:cytochrome c553
MKRRVAALTCGLSMLGAMVAAAAEPPGQLPAQPAPFELPAWLYPANPPPVGNTPPPDGETLRHLPGSSAGYTQAQLADRFVAPDWRPRSHGPMPLSVALGRAPDVYACGYCHTAGGQGRPENAALAGLPAGYMLQQLDDFKSGARRAAGTWGPVDLMVRVAEHGTRAEFMAAVRYFETQRLGPRVKVIESERVPRPRVVGLVYAAAERAPGEALAAGAAGEAGYADEALGQRLLEFAPDPVRHELRDDQLVYQAYVPPGSIERGAVLAAKGPAGPTTACASCHGKTLHGIGLVPAIAGRSPSSLLRQLVALRTGARHGSTSAPMQPVVAAMDIGAMIDAVAYAASLSP